MGGTEYQSYIGVPSAYKGEALLQMLSQSLEFLRRNAPGPLTHLDICMKKPDATTRAAVEAWALMNGVEVTFFPFREANRRSQLEAEKIRRKRQMNPNA